MFSFTCTTDQTLLSAPDLDDETELEDLKNLLWEWLLWRGPVKPVTSFVDQQVHGQVSLFAVSPHVGATALHMRCKLSGFQQSPLQCV